MTSLLLPLPLILLTLPAFSSASASCEFRDYGYVCVCNSTFCDTIPPLPDPLPPGHAALYMSSASGKRFKLSIVQQIFDDAISDSASTNSSSFSSDDDTVSLELDLSRRFQTILGFGGAFTDSVGLNLNSLSVPTRKQLLRAYFGPDSIGYTLGRVPIGSTDFSARVYSYDDVPEDFELAHFALAPEDLKLKIPYLRMANWLSGGKLRLIATPWSAPGWMKDSGQMSGGGPLKGPPEGRFYATWAAYLVRFFEAYKQEGLPFWALTVQNEPISAGWWRWYEWQAMYMGSGMQRDFVRFLLGPALRNNSATAHLKLIINDDNRAFLPSTADTIFADPDASRFVDGVAVHWYWNRLFGAGRLSETHERHPTKFILPSEACNGWGPFFVPGKGVRLGDWSRGEAYARDIIETLENWAVGWVDWNLCLDEGGGPSWARNWVDAPIIVDSHRDRFYKQPMFYALGHFSTFMRPDSVRIASAFLPNSSMSDGGWTRGNTDALGATAVLDPIRKRLVVVVQNRDAHDVRLQVRIRNRGAGTLTLKMEQRSIATLVIPWDGEESREEEED